MRTPSYGVRAEGWDDDAEAEVSDDDEVDVGSDESTDKMFLNSNS